MSDKAIITICVAAVLVSVIWAYALLARLEIKERMEARRNAKPTKTTVEYEVRKLLTPEQAAKLAESTTDTK